MFANTVTFGLFPRGNAPHQPIYTGTSQFRRGASMKGTAKNSLDDRLSLLEYRVSLMEAGKKSVKPSETENILSTVGLSYMLGHINEKIRSNPDFDSYDIFLEEIFKIKITPQNRLEYAEKVSKLSLDLLDDAIDVFKKRKA